MDQVGIGNATFNQSKGFHTFGHRLAVKDHTGSEVGAIQWGGRQGERLMFEVKGEATPGSRRSSQEPLSASGDTDGLVR